MECPNTYLQIEKDLSLFPKINLKKLAKEAVNQFGVHHALCHYSIINNQVSFWYALIIYPKKTWNFRRLETV